MPKSEHANSTTRRSALTGLLAETTAEIVVSPAVGGAGADAELIRTCEQFHATAQELAAILRYRAIARMVHAAGEMLVQLVAVGACTWLEALGMLVLTRLLFGHRKAHRPV